MRVVCCQAHAGCALWLGVFQCRGERAAAAWLQHSVHKVERRVLPATRRGAQTSAKVSHYWAARRVPWWYVGSLLPDGFEILFDFFVYIMSNKPILNFTSEF